MHLIDIAGGGRMPAIGLGTWRLGGRECARSVALALRLGYRHVDTAEMYANESEVGEGIRAAGLPRSELFVTTKIWTNHFRAAAARHAAEASLERLGLDHVDLLLMHWPNDSVPLAETLGALADLMEQGKTRAIGVSNFPRDLLQDAIAASPAPIACDQVRYHPGRIETPLLDGARRQGVAITAHSPLGQGELVRNRTLEAIGSKHGKSAAQVALRWLVEQDGVAAIPKSMREENLRANIAVFDFTLDDADRTAIAKL